MDVRVLTGRALEDVLEDVAALRIEVFREWPYLYEGDLAYEAEYLQAYRNSERAIVVGVFDGDRLVGASTGAPLSEHADDFAAAFDRQSHNLDAIFYCAESVLLPMYRGQGFGHRFFDLREAYARDHGFAFCAFCGVVRPVRHPDRPADYRPLDGFWRARGYAPLEGAVAYFSWKDVGHVDQTQKPLQFWLRRL